MIMIVISPDEATEKRLGAIAAETGRTIEDLADSAVSEAALEFFRGRPDSDDPGRQPGIVMRHTGIVT